MLQTVTLLLSRHIVFAKWNQRKHCLDWEEWEELSDRAFAMLTWFSIWLYEVIPQ